MKTPYTPSTVFMPSPIWQAGHYVSGWSVRLPFCLPMGTTLCAAPSNSYDLLTNYYACMQCPHDVDVHLFCFDLDLHFNFFSRSCLTRIFFINLLWWISLCVQCPAKAMSFQQIIMLACICPHDVDVHLFCFDLDLHFNLFSRSCLTRIFFINLLWWIPLCVHAVPSKSYECLSCMHCNAHMM